MLEKLKEIMESPATPLGAFGVILVVDTVLHRMQAFTVSYVICCILFVVMLLSTVINYRYYGKIMKYICLFLCAFTALFLITDAPSWDAPDSHNVTYGQQKSGGYQGVRDSGYYYDFDDGYFDDDDSFAMDCNRCHGSGRCEDCGGSGKSKFTGVLAAGGCALCDASGDCYKCGGKGYTVHY